MAAEELMNLLTEAEQALASIALPLADTAPAARPHRWPNLHHRPASAARFQTPGNTSVTLRIELGRAQLRPSELVELRKGAVVPLDKSAGDAVDIYASGRLAARGEVVEVDGKFGVRVVEILDL